jgi:hypothetical protein
MTHKLLKLKLKKDLGKKKERRKLLGAYVFLSRYIAYIIHS